LIYNIKKEPKCEV